MLCLAPWEIVLLSLKSWDEHQNSRENNINYFPQDQTLCILSFSGTDENYFIHKKSW